MLVGIVAMIQKTGATTDRHRCPILEKAKAAIPFAYGKKPGIQNTSTRQYPHSWTCPSLPFRNQRQDVRSDHKVVSSRLLAHRRRIGHKKNVRIDIPCNVMSALESMTDNEGLARARQIPGAELQCEPIEIGDLQLNGR